MSDMSFLLTALNIRNYLLSLDARRNFQCICVCLDLIYTFREPDIHFYDVHKQTGNAGEEWDCSPSVKPCAAVAAVPALLNLSLPLRSKLHPPQMQALHWDCGNEGIAVPALIKAYFFFYIWQASCRASAHSSQPASAGMSCIFTALGFGARPL